MKKPLIGIVPDYRSGSAEQFSAWPHYALRTNYPTSIEKAGGVAILLPYDHSAIDYYLNLIDGLMMVGGNLDINPKRYGEKAHEKVVLNETRENFEFEILGKALLIKDFPIFGICNGMQLINVLHQGTIIQHIPDEDPQFMNHLQEHHPDHKNHHNPYHQINIKRETRLRKIIGQDEIKTNSSHHQAIKKVGNSLVVAGSAPDGIIEAIEKPDHKFCIGVQWHPEFESSTADQKLFEAFVAAAKKDPKIIS